MLDNSSLTGLALSCMDFNANTLSVTFLAPIAKPIQSLPTVSELPYADGFNHLYLSIHDISIVAS